MSNNSTTSNESVESSEQLDLSKTVEAAIAIGRAFDIVDSVLARDPRTQELREALDRVPVRRTLRLVREAAGVAETCH